jgi:hypothetical protein
MFLKNVKLSQHCEVLYKAEACAVQSPLWEPQIQCNSS